MLVKNLKVNIEEKDNTLFLTFNGHLDETFKAPQLPKDNFNKIVFDLAELSSLNSLGIRYWILWMNDLVGNQTSAEMIFRRCPSFFVNQIATVINMVPEERSHIESLYVPYICESCEKEVNKLLVIGEDFTINIQGDKVKAELPEVFCNCGTSEPMDIDIVPRRFFTFALLQK